MSNFRVRVREAVKVLCLHESELKYRLKLAICEQLLLANVPEDTDVPIYFREQLSAILSIATEKTWSDEILTDRVGATIHGKHGKTLSSWVLLIWQLHDEYEEYLRSGFIP